MEKKCSPGSTPFRPDDIEIGGKRVDHWFNLSFTPQEARFWVDLFARDEDTKSLPFLASYAREKGYFQDKCFTKKYKNKEILEKEYFAGKEKATDQEGLDTIFPLGIKAKIKVLDLSAFDLKGHLQLKGLTQLIEIDLSGNKLTSLELSDSWKKLTDLNVESNEITDPSFLADLVNLESLSLEYNTSLSGSLAVFAKLKKLQGLNITGTEFDADLEYLPTSLQELFYCGRAEVALLGISGEGELEKKYLQKERSGSFPILLDRGRRANLKEVEKIHGLSFLSFLQELYEIQVKRIFFLKEHFLQKRQQTINTMESIYNDIEHTNLNKYASSEEITKVMANSLAIGLKIAGVIFPKTKSPLEIASDIVLMSGSLADLRHNEKTEKPLHERINSPKEKSSILGEDFADEHEIIKKLQGAYRRYRRLFSSLKEDEGRELAIIDIIKEKFDLEGDKFGRVRQNQPDLFQGKEYLIYNVATNIGEKKSSITLQNMRNSLDKLTTNGQKLKKQLENQKGEGEERKKILANSQTTTGGKEKSAERARELEDKDELIRELESENKRLAEKNQQLYQRIEELEKKNKGKEKEKETEEAPNVSPASEEQQYEQCQEVLPKQPGPSRAS